MKIDKGVIYQSIEVNSIACGECFIWDAEVYMRVEPMANYKELNCPGKVFVVNLATGSLGYFSAEASVLKVDCSVVRNIGV